jgi:hypothetical protein
MSMLNGNEWYVAPEPKVRYKVALHPQTCPILLGHNQVILLHGKQTNSRLQSHEVTRSPPKGILSTPQAQVSADDRYRFYFKSLQSCP